MNETEQDITNDPDLAAELDAAIRSEEQAELDSKVETPEEVEQADADSQAMVMVGATAINVTAKVVEDLWPCLSYDVKTKEAALSRVIPLMDKYSVGMPAWLVPWKEEIDAGMFFGGLVFQGYFEIRKHKKAEAEAEAEAENNEASSVENEYGGFKNGEETEQRAA